jgi:hypothetical protein
MFSRSGNTVVGLYVGREIHKPSAAAIVQKLIDFANANPVAERLAAQSCPDKAPSPWLIAIYADSSGDIAAVQDIVRRWSDAECLAQPDSEDEWRDTEVLMLNATDVPRGLPSESGLEQPSAIDERRRATPRRLPGYYG